MKALKYIGIILGVLLGAWIIWAAISPARMDNKASIEIDRDPVFVYDVAKDFNLYREWNPWTKMDPEAKNTITGTGRDLGDSWSWDGKKMPKGGMVHTQLEEGKHIQNTLTFVDQEGHIFDEWNFEEKDGKTVVTWVTKAEKDTPFMMRPMMSLMMSGVLEKGLEDFKKLAEGITDLPKTKKVNTAYAPEVVEAEEITYLAIKDSCPVGDIAKHYADGLAKLQAYMKKNNIEPTGAPMAVYWNYDPNGSTTFEVGMPVKAGTKASGGFYVTKTDGGKTVSVMHMGEYAKSGDAHMAIEQYVKDNNLKIKEAIEIYENDPAKVKPEEVRTKVMYPVKD